MTRADGEEFFALRTSVQSYPLHEANHALSDLRAGEIKEHR